MTNLCRLFVCSCIALIASAFTFSLHGDVMQDMGRAFNFTQEQNGSIGKAIFWGMAAAMVLGGFICDFLGIKRVLFLALASHLAAVSASSFPSKSSAPPPASTAIIGCGRLAFSWAAAMAGPK